MKNFENSREGSEEKIELKRASLDYIHLLLEIERSTLGAKTYSGYFKESEIKEYIENDIVYLIKDRDEVVGSISYEVKSDEHAYVSGLVIKPEFRGKGLARKAMVQLLKELENFEKVDLVVHPENERAVTLYESLGFKKKALKENFYGDGEPRLEMVRSKEASLL